MTFHVRVTFNNGLPAQRGARVSGDMKGAERLWMSVCGKVEKYDLTTVDKVEVKQGHKVLFMQRFENGKAL